MARKSRGTLYRVGRSSTYWLLYYVNGTRIRRSLGTADRREAEAKRQEIIGRLQTADLHQKLLAVAQDAAQVGALVAEQAQATRSKLTLAEAWGAYLRAKHRPQSGPHTLADYKRQWSRFVAWLQQRGKRLVEETTQAEADAYLEHCQEALALGPNRYNKTIQALKLIFRVLCPTCGGMANPFQNAVKQSLDPHPHRDLSEAELRSVFGAAACELRVLLALGIYCGFRLADACLLTWSEVDFERNLIRHVPNKTRTRRNKPVLIPIHPDLHTILTETPAAQRTDCILPGLAAQYRRDSGSHASRLVHEHFLKCGLVTQEKREGRRAAVTVSFHSLRHTFVSLCARAGISLPVVRELAGHHSEAIQRVYLHVSEQESRAAVNALPSLLVPGQPPPCSADQEALRHQARRLVETATPEQLRALLTVLTDTSNPESLTTTQNAR